MAVGESSVSLLDLTGAACDKSALVLDFGSIDLLASKFRASKGKNIAAIAIAPRASDLGATSSAQPLPMDSILSMPQSNPVVLPGPELVSVQSSSWASTVKVGAARQTLDFFPSVFEAGTSVLQFPPAVVDTGRKKFSLCLVGQFLGSAPNFGFIHSIANKLWGRDGPISIAAYKAGMFLFQFPIEASLSRALNGGPWHVNGIPLILRVWDSNIQKLDTTSSILPVWVQFNDVPLELSTREGLSYIASAVGKPLHMDHDCPKVLKTDRINVCIAVDFAKPLLPKLLVNLDGEIRTISISYSWKPQHCASCGQWGHYQLACPTKQHRAQWSPKAPSISLPATESTVSMPANNVVPVSVTFDSPKSNSGLPQNPVAVSSEPVISPTKPLPSPSTKSVSVGRAVMVQAVSFSLLIVNQRRTGHVDGSISGHPFRKSFFSLRSFTLESSRMPKPLI
ncbi:hypothetical protein Tsubulata_037957 [Turnera subulata]|uniref:DUF4283 domain-containing protein n=1 Tax=Turnera subulata TaxID=218843 RepID=A0A9Q0GH53_9ROSI|nr:hypothetical protein Tsubulata_037957 [Turnera subulata]